MAAHRKVGTAWTSLSVSHKAKWISAGQTYLERLSGAGFHAVTFDFDGTLCSKRDRFEPLNKRVVVELERLLGGGVQVGIATGRGQSVREQMRQSIRRDLWGLIWIGYYNGSDIAGLGDDAHPNLSRPPDESLSKLTASMKRDGIVRTIAKVESRPTQISLEPTVSIGLEELYRHAVALARRAPPGLKVLMSSHSIDIIPQDVSKTAVVHFMSSLSEPPGATLCIGDAGEFPGNDFELLSEPYSLSCDQVSADSLTCWNFAPSVAPGCRGHSVLPSPSRCSQSNGSAADSVRVWQMNRDLHLKLLRAVLPEDVWTEDRFTEVMRDLRVLAEHSTTSMSDTSLDGSFSRASTCSWRA